MLDQTISATSLSPHFGSFQREVRKLRALDDEGLIEIRREHRENVTGEG